MIRLFEIGFLAVIIAITTLHAEKFADNKPIGPLFHTVWALIYFIPVLFFAWKIESWWLLAAGIVERFVFYNPVLNIWRGKEFFYIHSGKNGSIWDDLESRWANFYPYAWGVGMLLFIILQFIL